MSFVNSFSKFTAGKQKALKKSWAKVFVDEISLPLMKSVFLFYAVINMAFKPNIPVDVIVGALIIKEFFDYSDDEMVENLMLDFQIQYALHITSFEELPSSDKTLSRFCKRCYDYETLHNRELYHDYVKELSASSAKPMETGRKVRCIGLQDD